MLKNIYQSNHNVWRGLMALLCVVCALLAPPAKVLAATKTAVLTFNGYTLDPAKYPADVTPVSLDCSDLEPFKGTYQPDYKSTISAGDIIFKILSPNANDAREESKVVSITYTGKQALILVNQQFRFSPKEEGMAISDVTLFFREVGATANAYYENKLQTFTSEAPTLLTNEDMEAGKAYPFKKQEATFVAPYSQAEPYKGVFLQAAVITYDDGQGESIEPIADPATVSFVMPTFESNNATVVSVTNGTDAVQAGDEIAEDAELTVVLKPSSNDEVIKSVAYNGSDVSGENSTTDGTWTGTIKYVSGAEFSVVTEKKTVDFAVPTVANATVSVMDGNNPVGSTVAIGTTLTVTITPIANYVVDTVTYGGEPVSGTTAADGKWTGTITVKEGAQLAVETAIKTVSFTVPTVDNATVKVMNGNAEVGSTIAIGTQLSITVTPDNDYVVNSVIYNDKAVGTAGANGVWTGTFTVVENGKFEISVTKKTVNFALPSITGVKAVVKNGDTELTTTTAIPVGTSLTVTLTPTDVSKKIATVTYAGEDVTENGTVSESGVWTGTITVANGATTLSATTVVKTFTVKVGSTDGSTVKLYDSSTKVEITSGTEVEYGTIVGIEVSCPNDKSVNTVTYTNADGNATAPVGDGNYAAKVKITSATTIDVTLIDKQATTAQVSFPDVTGGEIMVVAGGKTLTNPTYVEVGTELVITLVPADGYAIGTLSVDGNPVELTGNSAKYTVPDNAKSVTISATFQKVWKVMWTAPSADLGTMTVLYNNSPLDNGGLVKGGEKITVKLSPTQSDMITSLQANGKEINSTDNVYTVTVTEDTELIPYIGKKLGSFALGIKNVAGGTVTVYKNEDYTGSVSNNTEVEEGTVLYGKVQISSGYTLESLTLSPTDEDLKPSEMSEARVSTFSFKMPGRAVDIVPVYSKIVPEATITVSIPEAQASMGSVSYKIGDKGSVTLYTAPFTAKQGDVITFTITANPNYRIKTAPTLKDYTVNTATEKTGTYTVGTSNATLNITFEEIPVRTLTVTGINLTQLPAGVVGLTATSNGRDVVFGETEVPEGAEIKFTIEADPEYEITSFSINNAAGTIADGAGSATAIYTVPTNTAKPSVSVTYTVKHRVTNIQFELNETGISSLGTVVATYEDGSTTKTISPTASSESTSVPTNTPLTVKVTPKSGYMVASLTINEESIDISEYEDEKTHVVTVPDCYTTPKANAASKAAADLKVDVSFKEIPVYYSLKITATGGTVADKNKPLEVEYGTVTYSGVANLTDKVLKGTEVKITATPNTNYQIKSITVNGQAQSFDIMAASVTFNITLSKDTEVKVVFEPRTYRVQVSAPATIGEQPYIGSNKDTSVESFKSGTTVIIHAPANPGYNFKRWLRDGQPVMNENGTTLAGANYSFTMPQRDVVFTAEYEAIKYKPHSVRIKIADGQKDFGTIKIISPTSDIWTSWDNNSAFIDLWDQMVKVEAIPNDQEPGRYYFDSWIVTGAAAGTITQTNTPECGILEYGGNNGVEITAKFAQNYKVSVVAPVNGTIEVTTSDGTVIRPNTPIFVKSGTRVNVTMTSNRGYNVATLVVNEHETTHYNRPGTFSQTVTINEDTNLNALFYNPNGIEDIEADNAGTQQPEQWFTVQGRYVGTERPTQAGIYIRRCGSEAEKVVIR